MMKIVSPFLILGLVSPVAAQEFDNHQAALSYIESHSPEPTWCFTEPPTTGIGKPKYVYKCESESLAWRITFFEGPTTAILRAGWYKYVWEEYRRAAGELGHGELWCVMGSCASGAQEGEGF